VIIPHAGGRELLAACLDSLFAAQNVDLEIIIVDNCAVSDVDDSIRCGAFNVQILRYECNLGFAAACNRGVEAASHDLVFLLNNDAVVEPDCISILAKYLSSNHEVVACQPKILSLLKPGWFDYSSAAGGEMDVYGYPFARGRIFDTLEPDKGQYDDTRLVFWGAGAALMIKRELFIAAGGLTEWFFAHMEEIDLLWRLQLMGYRVAAVGTATAYHRGAMTIRTGSFRKFYLNHRNSLAMMALNYSFFSLLRFLPVRLWLDLITSLYSLIKFDFRHSLATIRADIWLVVSFPFLWFNRRRVQRLRQVKDNIILKRLFPKSIVRQYFVCKKQVWSQLQGLKI